MCGLIGMVGYLDLKHKNAMKELFFLNTLRGKDSTGLAAVKRDRSIMTRKMTVPGYDFIEYPQVNNMMEFADQLWLGHGRLKTMGAATKLNAHPFEIFDENQDVLLVGAHNGTLSNKFEIERELKDRWDTDSEGIFNLLSLTDTKEAIGMLKGAWSLTWWDAPNDKLHFCRNKERPLVYAYSKDKKVLVWASEAWMIINACRRNGVELFQNDKGMSCYATLPDTLYTLEIPQGRDVVLPELLKEGGYSGAPEKTFQPRTQAGPNWWYGQFENDFDEPWDDTERFVAASKKETEGGTKETTQVSAKESNVVTIGFPPEKRGYKGEIISKVEFDKVLKAGCVWCKGPIKKTYAFIEEKAMICGHCLCDTHDKADGDRVHPDIAALLQKDSPEYKSLIAAAVTGAKTVD